MRRWTIGALVALLLLVGMAGDVRQAGVVSAEAQEVGVDVGALITEAALWWGVSPALMLRIARCESRLDPLAVNASRHSGLFQFQTIAPWGQRESTWSYASRNAGYAGWSPLDPTANAYSAAWLARTSGLQHWRACL